MQESKSSGLGASFGGDASDSLFGVSTPKVLKVITGWLSVVFMTACLFLSAWTSARGRWHADRYMESTISQEKVTQKSDSQKK